MAQLKPFFSRNFPRNPVLFFPGLYSQCGPGPSTLPWTRGPWRRSLHPPRWARHSASLSEHGGEEPKAPRRPSWSERMEGLGPGAGRGPERAERESGGRSWASKAWGSGQHRASSQSIRPLVRGPHEEGGGRQAGRRGPFDVKVALTMAGHALNGLTAVQSVLTITSE